MVEVNFAYNGINTTMYCKNDDKFQDICEKYCIKIEKDINKLIFIYGGEILKKELKLKDVINQIDKVNLKMNILVYDNNTMIEKERIIESKDIICPKCGEICLINLNDYKIKLNNCKNKHENIILINEFEDTQNINENKIKCDICNNNKGKTYDNKFYICGECNKKICPLCKEKHNKEHKIIIDYDNKNYYCKKHNETYISYCDICKENLCFKCDMEHDNNHRIILYREIKPNINKNKMKEIKDIIDKFNNNID